MICLSFLVVSMVFTIGWLVGYIFCVYVSNSFSHPLCTHKNQGFAGRAEVTRYQLSNSESL